MLRIANTARKFLPMDALADTHTYNLLQLLNRNCVPYWRQNNAVRNENLDYWFERDDQLIMRYIASVLREGHNVCIPSASASVAVSISKTIIKEGWVKKSKVLVVTAMTPPEEKRLILKNFEQHIKDNELRVVIFSPTITAGCDISGDYFHAVVALVGIHSVTPHDMWQMTQRVRDPGVVVFWLRKMPLKPNEVSRVPLWRTLKVLNKPTLAWRVLNKTGKVFRTEDSGGPGIEKFDKTGIYKIIGPVTNEADNRRGMMEPSLRRFVRGTVGAHHLKDGLPNHDATEAEQNVSVEKVDTADMWVNNLATWAVKPENKRWASGGESSKVRVSREEYDEMDKKSNCDRHSNDDVYRICQYRVQDMFRTNDGRVIMFEDASLFDGDVHD